MDGGQDKLTRAPLVFHEVCERYDISPRTLRYYEALEILSPVGTGRQRRYDARQQVRLELTLRARRFRIPLEQARQLITLYDTDGPAVQAHKWHHVVVHQRKYINTEIRDLQDVRREMDNIVESKRPVP